MGATPVTLPASARLSTKPDREWKPERDSEIAKDLQGIIISAYPKHLFAMLIMVKFPASISSTPNSWISQLVPRVTNASGPRNTCLNVAISAAGLTVLGVKDSELETFSLPFQEGMTSANRARFLGDQPATWQWSDCAANANCVHAQLMVYARDQPSLDSVVGTEIANLTGFGLMVTGKIQLQVQLGQDGQRHEHFGFADGISQPTLVDGAAVLAAERALHEIPAGEVVLGQINTYDRAAPGPVVRVSPAAVQTLKAASLEGYFDLGLNGTYLVIRQLKQDVAKFWNNMKNASTDLLDETGKQASDVWLAQKAVGRTLDGDMLTPASSAAGNDMTFFDADQGGLGCPVTSHVRRANPRDGLAPARKDTQDMINASNRHRIMRRGRIYGAPIADRYTDDQVDRGLLFICMNSEIERQFEFVQHTWLLNPMFGYGYNESDPILGPSCPFSIPSKPVRQQPIIDTFITPVGGGYFFLPSLSALRYLGALG